MAKKGITARARMAASADLDDDIQSVEAAISDTAAEANKRLGP